MGNEIERIATDILGGLIGGAAGLSTGDPTTGTFVAVGVTPVAAAWVRRSAAEMSRRAVPIAEAAADASGLDPEDVVKRALEDQTLDPLVREILEAARRNGQLAALKILGAILGDRTVNGAPKIDEDILITRAIAELQAPHIEVMRVLSSPPVPVEGHAPNWSLDLINQAFANSTTPLAPGSALGGLTSHGLVTTAAGFGGPLIYELSPLGNHLLDTIQMAGGWQSP